MTRRAGKPGDSAKFLLTKTIPWTAWVDWRQTVRNARAKARLELADPTRIQ